MDDHLVADNVVARVDTVVLKVGVAGSTAMEREVALAADGAELGAPVLRPVSDVVHVGRFVVSVWPFIAADESPAPARLLE